MKRLITGRRGLGPTIAVASALLAFILTAVLAEFIGYTVGKATKNEIGQSLRELATHAARRLDRGMFERYREIQILAQARLNALTDGSREDQRRLIDLTQKTFPLYAWIGLVDLDGKVMVASRGMLEGESVLKRPWFSKALSGTYLMDLHEAKLLAALVPSASGEPARFLDIAFPVPGKDGKPQAVLGAHLSWDWAREVRKSIVDPVEAERKIDMLIAGSDGSILLGPPGSQGREVAPPATFDAGSVRDGFVEERWPDGRNYLVGYSKTVGYSTYPGLGWTVLVKQDLESAYAPVRELQRQILIAGLLIASVFSVAGFFIARRVSRPLEQLAQDAGRIESGQMRVIEDDRSAYREVGMLTHALNSLVGKLLRNEAALRELNAGLEEKVNARTAELAGALQEVRASQERIAAILGSSQDAFVALDLQGHVVDWNPRAAQMFGWSRQEALGQDAAQLIVPPVYRDDFNAALMEYRKSGSLPVMGRRIERLVKRRNGEEFTVEMTVAIAYDAGQPFFSAFLHDISERKKVEQMKTEFVSTVSHELRTPLTSIRMSLAMLQDMAGNALEPDAAQILTIANESCERLVRLINDILDMEKIESGKSEIYLGDVALASLLPAAMRSVQAYAREHRVEISVGGPAMAASIRADQDRMLQVLVNLLSNAIKFSPEQSEVELHAEFADGNMVRICVRDHGSGVPEEFRSRIFTRFAQADASDTGRKGGTGLGLAICKELVEAQGGRIGFESEEGQGAVFWVEMPRVANV